MGVPDINSAQLAMSVLGGLIGGFSGFVANMLQANRNGRDNSRKVALAISGEIEALAQSISSNRYFREIGSACQACDGRAEQFAEFQYHLIRGEQDYTPVFRSLGVNIGALPAPLPRDIVTWYTKLSIGIERTRVLGDLCRDGSDGANLRMIEILRAEHAELTSLIETAQDLKRRLSSIGTNYWQPRVA